MSRGRTATDEQGGMRPEIASSWRRAELSGLDPGSAPPDRTLSDIDSESRLMAAAQPVLDSLAQEIAGTRFGVLLADRGSRIVDRRAGTGAIAGALDGVGARPGSRYSEEETGTNALASVYEVRHPMSVHGSEHFLERLKDFSCHGRPIVDRGTGRLAGVLDITGLAKDANPLLGPVAAAAARAIEDRLVESTGLRQRAVLAAYRARSARSNGRPVVAFADDLVLLNEPASDLLDGTTRSLLCERARHLVGRSRERGSIELPAGTMELVCREVDGVPGAVVVELRARDGAARPIPRIPRYDDPADPELERARAGRLRTLVVGEPGTGRTHAGHLLAGDAPVLSWEPDDLRASAAELRGQLRRHDGLTLVEHVHLLDDMTAARLRGVLDACPGRWVALTTTGALTGEQQALAARCAAVVELRPLRHRREDIPRLARSILAAGAARATLTPSAERALMHRDWPGNLQELASVLTGAAALHPGRPLQPADLGQEHRTRHQGRPLTPLQQAEADTVLAALRRAAGNKSHAAAELGISRTTLYRRVRELGLE